MRKKIILILLTVLLCLPVSTMYAAETEYSENLIPKMTSNTAPSGIASSSTEFSIKHQPFHAFDHEDEPYGWATANRTTSGWIAYEFESPKVISKYVILPRGDFYQTIQEAPKDWTFEGWDGSSWIVLDTKANISNWIGGQKKEFIFNNTTEYKKYRLNITANNGYLYYTTLGEMEMMSTISSPTPTPIPKPYTSGSLLTIYLTNGQIKEYDLTAVELEKFLTWFDNRSNGSGPQRYAFMKNGNKGPFKIRTEYLVYDKIINFNVDEYEEAVE